MRANKVHFWSIIRLPTPGPEPFETSYCINQSNPSLSPLLTSNLPPKAAKHLAIMPFFHGIPYRTLPSSEDEAADSTKARYFLSSDDAISNDPSSDRDIQQRRRCSFRQQLRPRSLVVFTIASLLLFLLGFAAALTWTQPQTLQKCLAQTSAYCTYPSFTSYTALEKKRKSVCSLTPRRSPGFGDR